MAGALMAGIVMDTSTFAHPNSTPRTLAVAAEPAGRLVGLGPVDRHAGHIHGRDAVGDPLRGDGPNPAREQDP